MSFIYALMPFKPWYNNTVLTIGLSGQDKHRLLLTIQRRIYLNLVKMYPCTLIHFRWIWRDLRKSSKLSLVFQIGWQRKMQLFASIVTRILNIGCKHLHTKGSQGSARILLGMHIHIFTWHWFHLGRSVDTLHIGSWRIFRSRRHSIRSHPG